MPDDARCPTGPPRSFARATAVALAVVAFAAAPTAATAQTTRPAPTYKLQSAEHWRAVAYDVDMETRREGLEALGRLAQVDPSLVADLIALLEDSDTRVRTSAADSLAEVALARPDAAPQATDALAARIAAEPADAKYGAGALVDALATVARRHPDAALPALRSAAGHPNPSVRLASLEPLLALDPEFGPPAATDVLVGVIDVQGYAGADESDLAYPVAAAIWVSGHGGPGEFASLAAPADRRRLAGALAGLLGRVDPSPQGVARDRDADRQLGYVAGALLALAGDAADAVPTLEKYGGVEVRLGKQDGGALFLPNLSDNSTTSVPLSQVAARVAASGGRDEADPRP